MQGHRERDARQVYSVRDLFALIWINIEYLISKQTAGTESIYVQISNVHHAQSLSLGPCARKKKPKQQKNKPTDFWCRSSCYECNIGHGALQ